MSVLAHPQNVAQPPSTSLFHLHHNVDVCASVQFFVGDVLLPVNSEDSKVALSFKASELACDLLIGSPGIQEYEWTFDL